MSSTVEITKHDGGRTIEVVASGKLRKADYTTFLPLFEENAGRHGRIGVVFVMKEFDGFDMWALWEDIKFEWNHYDDISRLAMVGDSDWKDWMAKFCKPFLRSEVREFEHENLDEARQWVRSFGSNGSSGTPR